MNLKNLLNKEKIKSWLNERTRISNPPLKRTPDYMRKWGGKWYWTGALITIVFLYEVITGLVLLLYYNPSDPYGATQYVLNSIPYGSLLLSTHLYGAYAMIILVYVHMFRNYFAGAYKRPREIQWIIGVILLALTLGAGYFGYSLTGDVLSYDAQDVGKGIASSIPVIGNLLVNIGFGNGTPTSLFSRFLGWHIIFAGLIFLLFGYHFYLAESNSMLPSGKISNYKAPAITEDSLDMKPWYPYNFIYMVELGMFTLGFVILVPSILGMIPSVPILLSPFPGPPQNSLAASSIPAYPPWFLLFAYKAVDFSIFQGPTSYLQAMTVFTLIPIIYFLAVPFIDRKESLHPLDRPIITSFGILSIVYLIVLSIWGAFTPGVIISIPVMLEVLLPPAIITIFSMLIFSKLWRDGKLSVKQRDITISFYIFITGLISSIIAFSIFISDTREFLTLSFSIRLFLLLGSISFFGIGTVKVTPSLPENKIKTFPGIGYVMIAIILVLSWIIALNAIRLNPYHQAMLVGVALGSIFILSGISVAIYRRIVYKE